MKLAVDVALLLPEKINDLVIELNQKFDSLSKLNKENNLPHITLAMGVIDESEIELVNNKIKEICDEFGSLNLKIEEVYHIIKPNGKKSFAFRIKLTDELKKLHGTIMKELSTIFTYDVSIDMFNQDDEVDPISTFWVENYEKKHENPDNFHAHISLKCNNDVIYDDIPIEFKASKVALCHLGDHCTCRRVLGLVELN
jgi:hypothetical protein